MASGITVINASPLWVGTRYFVFLSPRRSRNPVRTSFSIIPALVAGVPRPLRSASSGISSAPAFSMEESMVSSVYDLGAVVFPSLYSAERMGSISPAVIRSLIS